MWDNHSEDCCTACQSAARKNAQGSFMDKENLPPTLSPLKSEDLSFYSTPSPTEVMCTGTSPNHCRHNIVVSRRSLEDHDPNSRDSGYMTTYNGDSGRFSSYASPPRGCSRLSCESGSVGSMEDELFEEFSDIEPLEDNLPQDFNKLISGPISVPQRNRPVAHTRTSPKDLAIRPLFRRALSLQNIKTTPNSSRVRSCLFKNVADSRPFKRPDPPMEFDTPTNVKKAKFEREILENVLFEGAQMEEVAKMTPVGPRILQRALSATEESIMSAVQRSSTEPDLIGDFSKSFCLPLTPGRHQDLKSITPGTLAQLMGGIYDSNVASFKVIDCRYPYEYDGGHIDGAINIYTKDQCLELLKNITLPEGDSNKRSNILVFHCEFSSERGPNLCRYLRKQDRNLNQDIYPSLHYPECYILEGGYKKFFEQHSNLCVPIAYKEMLDPEHENELRYFRQKSKTWNVDTRQRPQQRNNNKKLGL